MQVAAPEACFQAPTADECYEEIQRWIPSTSLCWRASFFTVFERLCLEDLTEPMRQSVAALGPLNLFTIISGNTRLLLYQTTPSATNPKQDFILWFFNIKASSALDTFCHGPITHWTISKISGIFTRLHVLASCLIPPLMRAFQHRLLCGEEWAFAVMRETSGYWPKSKLIASQQRMHCRTNQSSVTRMARMTTLMIRF